MFVCLKYSDDVVKYCRENMELPGHFYIWSIRKTLKAPKIVFRDFIRINTVYVYTYKY